MSETNSVVDSNPYRSPSIPMHEMGPDDPGRSSKLEEIGGVALTWEKLRLVYNVIGFFPTALIVVVIRPPFIEVAFCVFLANLCFCLGPLIDGYLTWFGIRHRAVTVILFALGTLLMLLLAGGYAVATLMQFFPAPN
jgi:hypothetical protein